MRNVKIKIVILWRRERIETLNTRKGIACHYGGRVVVCCSLSFVQSQDGLVDIGGKQAVYLDVARDESDRDRGEDNFNRL